MTSPFHLESPSEEWPARWCSIERRWEVYGHVSYRIRLGNDAPPGCLDHLQDRVYKPWSDREGYLNFGDHAGLATIANTAIYVRSKKADDDAFEAMLADVARVVAQLPFDFDTPTGTGFEDAEDQERAVIYHRWLQLRNWMEGLSADASLPGDFARIVFDPHRRMAAEHHAVDVSRATDVTPTTLLSVMCAPANLVELAELAPVATLPLARRLAERAGKSVFPAQVRVRRTVIELDTPENRFVKHVLRVARDLNREFGERVASQPTCLNGQLALDVARYDGALHEMVADPFFAEVGELTLLPLQSMALQRREGYRGFLRGYARLQAAVRFPIGPEDLRRILELKDAATLYEYWTYFQVAKALDDRLGPPGDAVTVTEDDGGVGLAQRTRLTWRRSGSEVRLLYNETFKGGMTQRSYSVELRPDIVLEVGSDRYVFDAKFKLRRLEWDDDGANYEKASAKREDIYKMHTYKDALAGVRAAYVLFPGPPSASLFFDDPSAPFRNTVHGVGAIPLRPGEPSGRAALAELLPILLGES